MIRRQHDGGWLLITQPDHAKLAGEFAQQWGNEEFARPEPSQDVLLAIAEHDNGWRELDAMPELNPANKLPYHFSERPLADHFALWRRAEVRFLGRSRYASLLISRHGSTLFRYQVDPEADPALAHPFFGQETWRSYARNMSEMEKQQILRFVKEREEFQRQQRSLLLADPDFAEAAEPARLNFSFRLLQVCDALSLFVCLGPPQRKRLPNIARRGWDDRVTLSLHPAGETGAVVEPYPFRASPLQLRVRGRKLPPGPFRDASALEDAWRRAPEQTLVFTVQRPG